MDWDKYVDKAAQACDELYRELSAYGIDQFADSCCKLGRQQVVDFRAANAKICHDLLQSRPSDRKRLLRSHAEGARQLLLLGALHEARLGLAFLKATCDRGMTPGPYRLILGQAAAAATDLLEFPTPIWPIEVDQHDPFGEREPESWDDT